MSILIKGMEMPKDCPVCPMSHWDAGDNFRGCEIVPGKKHAICDPEYANSDHRPNWCPLVPVTPHHGRLIDADELANSITGVMYRSDLRDAPTVIEAEEGET